MYRDSDITFLNSLQETLEVNPSATQREIAARQGISLGMTNAWLGKLADKGWILMHKINRKTVRYALTAEGMSQIASSTANYMRKTFALMKEYGDIIEENVKLLKNNDCCKIVLVGKSNIDFLLEYACHRNNVEFCKIANLDNNFCKDDLNKVFYLAGEDVQIDAIMTVFDFLNRKK